MAKRIKNLGYTPYKQSRRKVIFKSVVVLKAMEAGKRKFKR